PSGDLPRPVWRALRRTWMWRALGGERPLRSATAIRGTCQERSRAQARSWTRTGTVDAWPDGSIFEPPRANRGRSISPDGTSGTGDGGGGDGSHVGPGGSVLPWMGAGVAGSGSAGAE